jgi:phage-related protein
MPQNLLWPLDIKLLRSSSIQTTYKKKEAQFQGYCQTSPAGLNNKEYLINAQFIVNEDQRNTLSSFLEDTQGYRPFLFSIPGYDPGYFTHGIVKESCLGGGFYRFEIELKTFNSPSQLTTIVAGDTQSIISIS